MPPLARIAPSVSDTVKMRVSSPERPDDSRFDTCFFPLPRPRASEAGRRLVGHHPAGHDAGRARIVNTNEQEQPK
ncbi:hypothetical protein WT01_31965 [Burkholderia cepacia]|nr:hypothetical protein WS88_04205 [Burkholderia cepacia]KVL50798.1 hypothetical protein WT01_31965 [Burkholderia cepacia]